jgi:hypothetical protein
MRIKGLEFFLCTKHIIKHNTITKPTRLRPQTEKAQKSDIELNSL